MQQNIFETTNSVELLHTINKTLKGNVTNHYGEHILNFENSYGKGVIYAIDLEWGISNLNYKVNLCQKFTITFHATDRNFSQFIFISKGNLFFRKENENNLQKLNRLQNIIFSSNNKFNTVIEFPTNTVIEFNLIYINIDKFKLKKNNILNISNAKLTYFLNNNIPESFLHLGNYSLKIAELVNDLNNNTKITGIIKSLQTEGIITLILAQHISEYDNYEKFSNIPDSLTNKDIEAINKLSKYIINNISEPITINALCKESGLHPKKLQAGFQLVFSKTVNEYIRNLKLEIAYNNLRNTDQSISEIVYNIGFKSRSYFSKIFTEKYGLLPIEYRKNKKN